MKRIALSLALAAASLTASAQDVLIRGATVHTAGPQGTLQGADVLVQGGVIRAVGTGLTAPAGVATVEAGGRPLTPGLFAGLTGIGLEEVSAEQPTNDTTLVLGAPAPGLGAQARPEFDVTLAYNPRSTAVPVTRVEGLTFTMLAAGSAPGGSIIAGQGGPVRLDGGFDAPFAGRRALFVNLGGNLSALAGNSRAGQYMLLQQAIDEARGRGLPVGSGGALLGPGGRSALSGYLDRRGKMVVTVDREADIRQVLKLAEREKLDLVLTGAAEGWRVARELAAARVPVFVDALGNRPASFDALAATLENAARLHAAGVAVSFSQSGDASHNARKVRQLAGNAVAHGLPWEAGLAGLTRVPAEAFGVADRLGTIEVGKRADLVLWSGDPLDVAHAAEQVWIDGKAIPMRSRQTELRDRYLRAPGALPRAYPAR